MPGPLEPNRESAVSSKNARISWRAPAPRPLRHRAVQAGRRRGRPAEGPDQSSVRGPATARASPSAARTRSDLALSERAGRAARADGRGFAAVVENTTNAPLHVRAAFLTRSDDTPYILGRPRTPSEGRGACAYRLRRRDASASNGERIARASSSALAAPRAQGHVGPRHHRYQCPQQGPALQQHGRTHGDVLRRPGREVRSGALQRLCSSWSRTSRTRSATSRSRFRPKSTTSSSGWARCP